MHLIFLGTASCYPSKHRGVSCTALRLNDGDLWLFDCGEGSQIQIQKSSLHCGRVKKIFITHLHGDHLFGLPGFMCTIGTVERTDSFLLEIFGPLGLRRYLRESLNLSRSPLNFKYVVHELIPLESQYPSGLKNWKIDEEAGDLLHPQEMQGENIQSVDSVWTLVNDKHGTVKAGMLEHRVPCFGYVLEQLPTLGTLKVDLLQAKGVPPGPDYGRLKRGESLTLPSGDIIHPADVMGPPIPGLKLTILGDTCHSKGMLNIARGSDVVVHEATLEDGLMEKALENGHSTPSMAAAFAHSIQANHLILFHFSQRYSTDEEEPSLNILLKEAKEAFQKLNYECKVTIARDLMELNFTRNRSYTNY